MLADLLFAERMKNKLNEWRSQLRNASSESSNWSTQSTETVFYHMRPALCQSAGSHFSPAQTFSIANSLCSEIKFVFIFSSVQTVFSLIKTSALDFTFAKHFRDLVYIHTYE